MKKCPHCGSTLEDIEKNNGRLGCPNDYNVFREELLQGMERYQHELTYFGKKPNRQDILTSIDKVKRQMKHAISNEDFERAAELQKELEKLGV